MVNQTLPEITSHNPLRPLSPNTEFMWSNEKWSISVINVSVFSNLPLSTACPNELWREVANSCEVLVGFSSFLIEDLLERTEGSSEWELRLCVGNCSSSAAFDIKGFATEGSDSGVCLLVREEDKNELLNLDSVGVPRIILGDGTLL